MIGTAIGLIFALVFLGLVWWAVVHKFWPLISPYVAEPFNTAVYVVIVIVFVLIVLWLIMYVLGLGGIHVKLPQL